MKWELLPIMKYWRPKQDEYNTIRINIDILTICNNKCPYCYSRADKKMWGLFMKKDFIIHKLEYLSNELSKKGKLFDIILLGGEPTIHPSIKDIIHSLSKLNNTKISITSNGNKAYGDVKENNNVRWAFTWHPSQIKDDELWFNNILKDKQCFWEVSIHPMVDLWADEKTIISYTNRMKNLISWCNENKINIQPVFQNNPYSDNRLMSIDIPNIKKYYSFLSLLPKYYKCDDKLLNDYEIITNEINIFKHFRCTNNFFSMDVMGNIRQNCSYKKVNIDDLLNYSCKDYICPLDRCICIGFSSLYKEL